MSKDYEKANDFYRKMSDLSMEHKFVWRTDAITGTITIKSKDELPQGVKDQLKELIRANFLISWDLEFITE